LCFASERPRQTRDHYAIVEPGDYLLQRLCFRDIYFPMMGRLAWLKVIAQNRRTIFKLVWEALRGHQTRSQSSDAPNLLPAVMVSSVPAEIATLEVES